MNERHILQHMYYMHCIVHCIYVQCIPTLHTTIMRMAYNYNAEHPLPLASPSMHLPPAGPLDAPPPLGMPSARPPLRGHHHTTGVLYSAYNTIQCTHNTIHIKYNRTRYNRRQYDTIRYDTIRHNRIRYDNIYDNIRSARPMTISLAAR